MRVATFRNQRGILLVTFVFLYPSPFLFAFFYLSVTDFANAVPSYLSVNVCGNYLGAPFY